MSVVEMSAQDFEELAASVFEQKRVVDKINSELDSETEKLNELKTKLLSAMETLDKDKLHVKGFGTISRVVNFSVKIPQAENRELFFNYLKDRGMFDSLVTVNSKTLNSWHKQEMEAAILKGDINFKVPGIDEPKAYAGLMIRKG